MGVANNCPEPSESFLLEEGEKKISFQNDTKVLYASTFTIRKEDHTLGNLLREQLLKDEHVLFAGYKNPHPLHHEIVLRIQTNHEENYSPIEALKVAMSSLLIEIEAIEAQLQEEVDNKTEVNRKYML